MFFTEFQKTIIQLLAEGKITDVCSFMVFLINAKPEIHEKTRIIFLDKINNTIKNNLLNVYNASNINNINSEKLFCRPPNPYVTLPYQTSEINTKFFEYHSLINYLNQNNLITLIKREIPNNLKLIELQPVSTNKPAEKTAYDATILLRENLNYIIISNQSELKCLITRKYKTVEEVELKEESKHRNLQFLIALVMAISTIGFGIITVYQNVNLPHGIVKTNTTSTKDTIVIKQTLISNGCDTLNKKIK